MGDAGNDDPPGARNAPLDEAGDEVDVLAVQLAFDDERRALDLAEPSDGRRLEPGPLGHRQGVRHGHLQRFRPHGRGDLGGRPVRPGEPRPEEEVRRPPGVARLPGPVALSEASPEVAPGEREPRHPGPDENERPHHRGPGDREVDRDPPAERETHEARALHLQRLHQEPEVLVVPPGPVRRRRAPVPGHVVPDEPVTPRERLHLRVPHPVVEHPAVDQDHGRTRAPLFVEELPAGDRHEPCLRGCGGRPADREAKWKDDDEREAVPEETACHRYLPSNRICLHSLRPGPAEVSGRAGCRAVEARASGVRTVPETDRGAGS